MKCESRRSEFIKRQVFYFKNIAVKLSKVKTNPIWSVYYWTREDNRRSLLATGIYNNEDPAELVRSLGIKC